MSEVQNPEYPHSQTEEAAEVVVVQGQLPTPDEVFYYELGEQVVKAAPERLQQTLMLLCVVASGGVAFGSSAGSVLTAALFVAAALAALAGIVPYGNPRLNFHAPYHVQRYTQILTARRSRWIKVSCSFLVLGFLAIIVGMIVKLAS